MADPKQPKHSETPPPAKRKRVVLLCACCAAAVLLLCLLVALALGNDSEPHKGRDTSPAPSPTPDRGILFNDRYRGPTFVPRFELPKNTYDSDKFVEEDGFLRYDSETATLGVDVSEFQGEIDWQQVKDAGIDFCILRVGYRGTTQGMLNEDSRLAENLAGAEAAGLKIGVYFFSQAVSEHEARKEADFVLKRLKGHEIDYPVVFDWEPPTEEGLRAYGMAGWQVSNFAAAFCKRIADAGYTACIYSNKNMAYDFWDLTQLADYALWYAEYQPVPSFYYDFSLWQYSESGSVPGIPVEVEYLL